MKTKDIKADGTVYWWDRRTDWGQRLTPSLFDCGPVTRLDDKRYTAQFASTGRTEAREDQAGQFIKVRRLGDYSRISYLPVSQIRATMLDAEAFFRSRKQAADAEETLRKERMAEGRKVAGAIESRLLRLRLHEAITVRVGYEGQIKLTWTEHPEAQLMALLARLEKAETRVAELERATVNDTARRVHHWPGVGAFVASCGVMNPEFSTYVSSVTCPDCLRECNDPRVLGPQRPERDK